jgi:hypothetical protein
MDFGNANRLLREIPDGARVLDVGGGAAPFPRADAVIDALPFDALGAGSHGNIHQRLGIPPRYTRESWIQADLCRREPWPIEDKAFDFVVCSHLLEDIRDPIWVCSELCRVGKAGYVEVPSRVEEQSKGVENPRHCGYYHHRWLITRGGDGLEFRHKPHSLHSFKSATVTHLRPWRRINPLHAIVSLDWKDHFEAREVLEFSEDAVVDELSAFAARARGLPELTVSRGVSALEGAKLALYYARLARGRR